MKRFTQYLKESTEEKKYLFKIKIAGDLPENSEDCMETSLQKYNVSKFTKGASTPIQETLLDFPEIKNSRMTVFEVELDYPTTSAVVTELIAEATGISKECIRVRTPQEESNWEIENQNSVQSKEKTPYKPLLTQEYEKSDAQKLVGDKHVTSFLKELSKLSKDSGIKQYTGINDALLAKKPHKEKAEAMPATGPARSLFGGTKKD